MIYYIAGPMRGIPLYNFPAFDDAAFTLRRAGHEVINPADLDRNIGFDPIELPESHDWNTIPPGFDFDDCVNRDIAGVRGCDAIYMLDGWERSSGARAEKALAEWLGKQIFYQSPTGHIASARIVEDAETGGRKEDKLARFDLIPAGPLWELSELYGRGAEKYADHNWRKGYAWHLSFSAAMRHLWQFWRGEDRDAETGAKHVISAAFHCLALAEFMVTNKSKDDRWKDAQ